MRKPEAWDIYRDKITGYHCMLTPISTDYETFGVYWLDTMDGPGVGSYIVNPCESWFNNMEYIGTLKNGIDSLGTLLKVGKL